VEIGPADICLAEAAVAALTKELEAYPKPGLVSRRDSGAHSDMDFELMRTSAQSLFHPLATIAAAGREAGPFESCLIPLGLAAEREMLRATGGINTHRGAIFTLGMILASMARAESTSRPTNPAGIRSVLLETWGDALRSHASADTSGASHGARVRQSTGAGGARAEAARGFPGIFENGVPMYCSAVESGLDPAAARIQTLFALMESAEDSNVIYRGGTEAADFVRRSAADFLAAGGCFSEGWFSRAEELHRIFIQRNLSPGGCADLLAGTLLAVGHAGLGQESRR
jgi:triphosphoribosyl-dephospho-CoA synthase